MKVLVHTRTKPADASAEVEFVGLENLLKMSDVVSLHCPLTKETEKLINKERLGRMKSSAFLINTSRGPLIDETALADALNKRVISGAGLDVLSSEPPGSDNPLLSARNCVITPHIAWATLGSRKRLMAIVVQNLRAFLQGNLVNVVNGVTTKG
jgi:glycerate dehydrogenase